MSGRLWRIISWALLLPVLALSLLPLTERGSQLVLDYVGEFVPLDIVYGGGTLAGELALKRLSWAGDSVQLDLHDVVLELAPSCWWHSTLCFRQLYARQLDIVVLPDPPAESGQPEREDDGALVEFPVPLQTENLVLDGMSVRWQGGEWRQGTIEGGVSISGSTISVGRAAIGGATLTLTDDSDSGEPVVLPEIDLPLELVVSQLELARGAWDFYGWSGQIDSARLRGRWSGHHLQLDELQLAVTGAGRWQGAGEIEFDGQWPVSLAAAGELPPMPAWPDIAGRELALDAGGDLSALELRAQMRDTVELSIQLSFNPLSPELPFSLSGTADWQGALALSALHDLPEPLASVSFKPPLQLAASGSLQEQVFQLEAQADGLGYESLAIRLAGSHAPGRLALEDLRLQDNSDNTLWGRGELDYAERVTWSAVLESSGLDLLPLAEFGEGRIEGQLQLLGVFGADGWTISLAGADIEGSLNQLPLRITGYGGIDSQLHLLPGELQGEFNGASLQLQAFDDASRPGRLQLTLENLGRWLPGSRGSLSVQALFDPDWQEISATGALQDFQWEGLEIATGSARGNYLLPGAGEFKLELQFVDLVMAGVELEAAELLARGDFTSQQATLALRGDLNSSLEVRGSSGAGGGWTGQLAPTTVQTAEGNWYLGETVALDYSPAPARLAVTAHCWQFQKTRVCPGAAVLGEEGQASIAVAGELSELDGFLPDYLELAGALQGQFVAAWAPGQPMTLDGEASGRDVRVTRHNGAGESGSVSWQKIDASVHRDAGGLVLNAGVYGGDARILTLDLQLPPDPEQPLSGGVRVDGLQLSALAPLAPSLSVLEGELRGQLTLHGTVKQPLAEGALYLSGGQFAVLGNPTELQQLELRLDALGDSVALQGHGSLGGGQLAINGQLQSQPDWRLQLSTEGERHEILLPPFTQMLVSEQLELVVSAGRLDLGGDIVVHEGSLEHEQLPAGSVTLSDDVVEVDLRDNVIYKPSPFDISMRVGVLMEDKFMILGDMVNATVGGDLQLRQEARQPLQVFGNLNVIGGELRAYQQRLRIKRGTVSFAGRPENPELDVRAQREIATDNVVVGLQLQGTLQQPRLEVYSDPVMSHGEAMSYLLRGRGLDAGAGSDGVAMALSVGTGLVNQTPLVTELNRIPGISNLAFGAEGSDESDTAATVGGYIGERLYLSYGMGIYEPINVLTARLYLQTRLWLEVVSRLENSVDLYYSFDID